MSPTVSAGKRIATAGNVAAVPANAATQTASTNVAQVVPEPSATVAWADTPSATKAVRPSRAREQQLSTQHRQRIAAAKAPKKSRSSVTLAKNRRTAAANRRVNATQTNNTVAAAMTDTLVKLSSTFSTASAAAQTHRAADASTKAQPKKYVPLPPTLRGTK
jgi:hypothetical protein